MIDETQERYQIEFYCSISKIENKFQIVTINLREKHEELETRDAYEMCFSIKKFSRVIVWIEFTIICIVVQNVLIKFFNITKYFPDERIRKCDCVIIPFQGNVVVHKLHKVS